MNRSPNPGLLVPFAIVVLLASIGSCAEDKAYFDDILETQLCANITCGFALIADLEDGTIVGSKNLTLQVRFRTELRLFTPSLECVIHTVYIAAHFDVFP